MVILLETVPLRNDCLDSWCWLPNNTGVYSSKSDYLELYMLSQAFEDSFLLEDLYVFGSFWKTFAPTKVVFSWQVLLDRFPSKVNQFSRNVIEQN